MNSLLSSVCLVFGTLSIASCASVPVPATKAADSPASPAAAEGHRQKLGLFDLVEAPTSPVSEASPKDAAMKEMDHSKMDHSAPEAKPATTDSSPETYTCVMHPQIAEPKPGKCPICGMPLVKKPREKK